METDILRYKYLPFDEGSLSVLSEGTMKFTKPIEFNDPFDCVPVIDEERYLKYISSQKELFKEAGKKLGYSPSQRIQKKKQMLKNIEKGVKDLKFVNFFAKSIGICSLSRDPLNLLMWAHYTNNHKGFVVEFSIPNVTYEFQNIEKFSLNNLFPLKVNYSETRPKIDLYEDDIVNMERTFLSKSIDWQYEQEERVIDYIRGPGIHPYDRKRILKSVIAGLKIERKDYEALETTINNLNQKLNLDVKLYKAQEIKGKFGIHIQK